MMMGLQFSWLLSLVTIHDLHAEVVKLANTLRSGRSGRKPMWVQLPPSAFLSRNYRICPASGGQIRSSYMDRSRIAAACLRRYKK